METHIAESQDMESHITNVEKIYLREIIGKYDNPHREGLVDTPKRYIKFLDEFFHKDQDFKYTTFENDGMDEMIIQKNIDFYSICEHHLVPFFGSGVIAYIPDKKIIGLSKLARCLDYYARRFQNQERITHQVAERIMLELQPKGVAVILSATHLCMSMRGIKKQNALTTTSKLLGRFKEDLNCRNELLKLIS